MSDAKGAWKRYVNKRTWVVDAVDTLEDAEAAAYVQLVDATESVIKLDEVWVSTFYVCLRRRRV